MPLMLLYNECPNTKIAKSQKCVEIFAPSFAHLFRRKLRLSVLLRDIFTSLQMTQTQTFRTNFATEQTLGFIKVTRAATTTFIETSL